MIVITTLNRSAFYVNDGDSFRLVVTGDFETVVIEELISKAGVIDFCASFRFAREDGTCVGNHFCGIFAKEDELPEEIKNAKQIRDLTPEQRVNFFESVNVKI